MPSASTSLHRRAVLAGMGSTVLAGAAPIEEDPDDLQMFFPKESKETVVFQRKDAAPLTWSRVQFGQHAKFALHRDSLPLDARQRRPVTGPLAWYPSAWRLEVADASFPGGRLHRLVFTISRSPISPLAFGPWRITLQIAGWPAPTDTARLFQGAGRPGAILPLDAFFKDPAGRLSADLPQPVAQSMLAGLFGDRIRAEGGITLSLDSSLTWYAETVGTTLRILAFPVSVGSLRIERTFGEDDAVAPLPRSRAGKMSEHPVRLFADMAPPHRPVGQGDPPPSPGLYAEAYADLVLPSLGGSPNTVEFASRTAGGQRLSALITVGNPAGMRAALRHWGEPALTVAGLQLGPTGAGSNSALAVLRLVPGGRDKTAEQRFPLAAVEITRRQTTSGTVQTRASLTSIAKEHMLSTPFGPIEVRAAPPVPPRPGRAARVPPITLAALDRASGGRELTTFDALLSGVSLGVRLPSHADPAREAEPDESEPVVRLELADAEFRFVLPILDSVPRSVAADALVPLGPDPARVYDRAHVGLDRARLSVLRPSDLMSLKFRFSGLLLEIPRLSVQARARVLSARGGPVCRAAGLADEPPTKDTRPILVVEFPPQHVAERAYFRRQPALPDLPDLVLALPAQEHKEALGRLRQVRPGRGKDPDGKHRRQRIRDRETLRAAPHAWRPALEAVVTAFEALAVAARLPKEQRIYIGPEFLDADAWRLAFRALAGVVGQFPPAASLAGFELGPAPEEEALVPFGIKRAAFDPLDPRQRDASDAIELAKDRANPDYAAFRARFGQAFGPMLLATVGLARWFDSQVPQFYRGSRWFASVRVGLPRIGLRGEAVDIGAWVDAYEDRLAAEPIDSVVEARLSGPSRLAFRVNCDDFQAEREGGGLDFSVEGLTNWGAMDLSVVRRAERLLRPANMAATRGPPPPRWARVAELDEAAILRNQGISPGDHLAVAQDKTARQGAATSGMPTLPPSLTGPGRRLAQVAQSMEHSPEPFQTAIELPFRLMLSPAQDGSFLTPNDGVWRKAFNLRGTSAGRPAEAGLYHELWSATLAGTGTEAGLRAVWSPDLRPEALLSNGAPGAPPHGPWAPWSLPRSAGVRVLPPASMPQFRTALDAYDRHEIVVLSSAYGLPVLGRRDGKGGLMLDGSQIDPPDGYHLDGMNTDAAPEDHSGPGGQAIPRDYSAIYRPQPLAVTELALTALGGNIDHDTGFTPPASAQLKPRRGTIGPVNLFDAMSIERWRNRTVLGRDLLVEVVYKGFLFPIGHKATLVKVTERRFEAAPNGVGPVAALIQREYLRIGNPVKIFPAYGQPNNASRWCPDRVTMLTRRTPDLVDHTDELGGGIRLPGGTGTVFWPRTARRPGAEVRFEMRIDDEGASCAMPLVFVDNTAAHDPPTMKALADWYNGAAPQPLAIDPMNRKLPRNGQAVRMAPAAKPGDTTFATKWWDLRAEGRELHRGAADPNATEDRYALNNTLFSIDPFMEGMDQPAFYPFINRARCRLGQVERFTGRPSVWADVAYDGYYVTHGFDPIPDHESPDGEEKSARANEVFLRLVKPEPGSALDGGPVSMRMAGAERSGGVGQPNLDIVGISRAIGPIGQAHNSGDGLAATKPAELGDAPTVDGTMSSLPSISAQAATHDASSIFPPDAKLLGLVPLSKILKLTAKLAEQPRLKEVTEYGAAGMQGSAAQARAFVTDRVLRPIQLLLRAVQDQWQGIAGKTYAGVSLEQAYPQIRLGLSNLNKRLAESLDGTLDDAAFYASLASVYEAGRAFTAALDAILRDPLASMSEAQAAALRDIVSDAHALVQLVSQLPESLRRVAPDVRKHLVEAVLGYLPWQRLMVVPPPLETALTLAADRAALPAAYQAAFLASASGALLTMVRPGASGIDLNALPVAVAAALTETAGRAADAALQAALRTAATRIKTDAAYGISTLLTPVGTAILNEVSKLLNGVQEIEAGLQLGLDQAVTALLRGLGTILGAADPLLAKAALLRPLGSSICGLLGTQVKDALATLLGALMPAGDTDPTAAESVRDQLRPFLGDEPFAPKVTMPALPVAAHRIELAEVCNAALTLVQAAAAAERALRDVGDGAGLEPLRAARIAAAGAGIRLSAAVARVQRELGWLQDWATRPWTQCSVPPELAASFAALTAARREALEGAEALRMALAAMPQSLLGAADWAVQARIAEAVRAPLREALASATDAVRGAGLALARLYRSATLLAALTSAEGDATVQAARAAFLNRAAAALGAVAAVLPGPMAETRAEIDALATSLRDAPASLAAVGASADAVAATFRGLTIPARPDAAVLAAALRDAAIAAAALNALAIDVQGKVRAALEKATTDLVDRLALAASDELGPIETWLADHGRSLVGPVADAYDKVLAGRDSLSRALLSGAAPGASPVLASLLRVLQARIGDALLAVPCAEADKSACEALGPGKDQLALEASLARAGAAALAPEGAGSLAAFDSLRRLAAVWAKPGPGLAILVRRIGAIDAEFVRTLVLSAIDLRAVRREVEARVRELIPARIVLPYDLDCELGPYPADDPIFAPDPKTGLSLHARTVISLVPEPGSVVPKPPTYSVTGEMGPFTIALLGERWDVVKLHFKGLSFKSGTGISPDFQVRFKNVELGEKARFLEDLQSYLSPKGAGFYIKALADQPGLEAGYGVNLGVIGVGTLSFSNVILSAAVRLRFDNQAAQFLISIGRDDAPFLISSTIFGGGGFLELVADSQAMVGYAASFDYGGVAAFGFGPLQGMGRLTMGITMRKEGARTTLGATFFAGGAAHIACFGFSTSLMVKLLKEDSGPMQGSADYTFSFSLGIDDIEFQITVTKNEGERMGGSGSKSASAEPGGAGRGSPWDGGRILLADLGTKSDAPLVTPPGGPALRVDGTPQHRDWDAYRGYFDLVLRPADGPRRIL